MLNICKTIFARLKEEKIEYCHWKSNEHLQEGLDGKTDLDILVSPKCIKKFINILRENQCIKVCPQVGSRYPEVEDWIGFDRDTGRLMHLHVHFKIITGTKYLKEYVLPWDRLALKTRILDETERVYVIDYNLELVILYMRIVLKQSKSIANMDKFELSIEYRKELSWLKKKVDSDSLFKLLQIIWKDEIETVLSILLKDTPNRNDFAILQKLSKDKVNTVQRNYVIQNVYLQKIYKLLIRRKVFLKSKFRIVPFTTMKTLYGGGCSFAFIGCDGSGKSSITKEICQWLGWKIDCQDFYFGMGEKYKKPLIYKIYKNIQVSDFVRRICGMLFYYCISLRCQYMRKILDSYVNRGGIAVCDRYPQTQFHGIYDGPKIRAFNLCESIYLGDIIAKAEENNLLSVEEQNLDCVFKLVISHEIALKRSPGHNAQEVKRKAVITEKLKFPHCDIFEIDATQPFEKELLQIKEIIWNKLLERQS